MPTVIELFSASLKDLAPNMKKKKADEFDALKASVIKASKSLAGQFKDYFKAMASYYADSAAITFMSAENAQVAASILASFEDNFEGAEKQQEALEQFVSKRTG